MGNNQHGDNERIAVLENQMKNVETNVKRMEDKVDDLVKKIYYIMGGLALITVAVEIGSKFIK